MSETHEIMTFGKYKGQPIEVLQADRAYCEWLSGQDWFRQRYPQINTLIINNFTKPEDTPEHNTLQAMFLDDLFCESLGRIVLANFLATEDEIKTKFVEQYKDCKQNFQKMKERNDYLERYDNKKWKPHVLCSFEKGSMPEQLFDEMETESAEKISKDEIVYNHYYGKRVFQGKNVFVGNMEQCLCKKIYYNQIDCIKLNQINILHKEFESRGIDVSYNIAQEYVDWPYHCEGVRLCIEIKPNIGDDYPSVIRQIKSLVDPCDGYIYAVLVYQNFTASGVTEEQMKKMFEASRIRVVSISEIEETRDKLRKEKGVNE